jgi:hypothetical protein
VACGRFPNGVREVFGISGVHLTGHRDGGLPARSSTLRAAGERQ